MLSVLANEDSSIRIPFMVDGEFVTPDPGSVKYTIRDNSGVPIAGHDLVSVTPVGQSTSVVIPLPHALQVKSADTENRYVTLMFTWNGAAHRVNQVYRVVDWMPYTADVQGVRSYIGLSGDEVRDDDVDVVGAYYELAGLVGGVTNLNAALTAGGIMTIQANMALIYVMTLSLLPSLRIRANQSEKSGDASWARFQDIDFGAIGADAASRLNGFLTVANPGIPAGYPIFIVDNPTDPVTGA